MRLIRLNPQFPDLCRHHHPTDVLHDEAAGALPPGGGRWNSNSGGRSLRDGRGALPGISSSSSPVAAAAAVPRAGGLTRRSSPSGWCRSAKAGGLRAGSRGSQCPGFECAMQHVGPMAQRGNGAGCPSKPIHPPTRSHSQAAAANQPPMRVRHPAPANTHLDSPLVLLSGVSGTRCVASPGSRSLPASAAAACCCCCLAMATCSKGSGIIVLVLRVQQIVCMSFCVQSGNPSAKRDDKRTPLSFALLCPGGRQLTCAAPLVSRAGACPPGRPAAGAPRPTALAGSLNTRCAWNWYMLFWLCAGGRGGGGMRS